MQQMDAKGQNNTSDQEQLVFLKPKKEHKNKRDNKIIETSKIHR